MKPKASPCAVLVVSCDNYRDTWPPFFELLRKNWPDCPYPVYHLTNSVEYAAEDVTTICVGSDRSWSDNLIAALRQIAEPYVLLLLDDLFVVRPVPTVSVAEAVDWLIRQGGNHLRLNALPKPELPLNANIGEIARKSAYRVSTVTTVWKREVLSQLLVPGESAWQFELAGSERADDLAGFYTTCSPLIKVENTIVKGKWRPSSVRQVKQAGVKIDTSRRPVMSRAREWQFQLRVVLNKSLHFLPLAWRRPIQGLVKSATNALASVGV